MNRMLNLVAVVIFACLSVVTSTSSAADMTVRLINNTERTMNLKLFSNGESHAQWPSKTRAYAIKPDSTEQHLKISCVEGEQICWGAWMDVQTVDGQIGAGGRRDTRSYKISWGAGQRGMNTCASCCNVCKDGSQTRLMKLLESPGINAK